MSLLKRLVPLILTLTVLLGAWPLEAAAVPERSFLANNQHPSPQSSIQSALAKESASSSGSAAPPLPSELLRPTVPYPPQDSQGYLTGETEFVFEDDASGQWVYLSQSLQVYIMRHSLPELPLEWFETEILCRGGERFTSVETNPLRHGTRFAHPFTIAAEHQFVLGFTDDFFGHRINRKETVGLVIREGELISRKTNRKRTHYTPNLDVLAQFPDGSLKAYESTEITAEELLALGVVNTYCFGPIVLKGSQIEPMLYEYFYARKQPRQALGMIAPGHYLLLSVQGRTSASKGSGLLWMAERMQALGVTEALNLDGGNTFALVFRGRMLNKLATYHNKKYVRTVSSLIGIGHTDYRVEE